jgi:hypothetical protein
MKTLILISILILFTGIENCFSQKEKLSRRERARLDTLARQMIIKFGDKRYHEACVYNPDIQLVIDNNKEKYVLTYHCDTSKIRFEYRFAAQVYILKNTLEPLSITFGQGLGYGELKKRMEEEKQGKVIEKIGFFPLDMEELKRQKQLWEEFQREQKIKEDSINKIYYKKLQREKDSLERKNN